MVDLSCLIDPSTIILSEGQQLTHQHLTNIIKYLIYPDQEIELNRSELDTPLPKLDSPNDCSLFICRHAIDFWNNSSFFSSPLRPDLRNEINKVIRDVIDKGQKTLKGKPAPKIIDTPID